MEGEKLLLAQSSGLEMIRYWLEFLTAQRKWWPITFHGNEYVQQTIHFY